MHMPHMPALPSLSDALKGVKSVSQNLMNSAYSAVAPVVFTDKVEGLQKIDPSIVKQEIPLDISEYFIQGDPTHP